MSKVEATRESAGKLSGNLGVGSIVFMVVAAAAPLTVIGGNVPLAVANGNGVGAPVGFLIASLVLLVFAVGFTRMTPYVSSAGAFYAYVRESLGNRLGLATAYVALVTYTAIQGGIYGYLGGAVTTFVASIGGPTLPWWLYAGLALLVVSFLGYRHIDLSAKVLGVALILEFAVVIIMDAAILLQGGAEGITGASFTPGAITSGPIGVAILFALTGFIGFESTAIFRDEARDPSRTIPRATYLAVAIIGVFYLVSSWALVEGWGPSTVVSQAQSNPDTFMLDATATYVGTVVKDIMNVLLLTSLFACVLSFHNVITRYQFNLANERRMPAPLGQIHSHHGSPSISSIVQTITAAALIALFSLFDVDPLVDVFGSMASVATVGMVLLLIVTSVAVVKFFAGSRRAKQGLFSTRIAPIIATIALCGCLYLVLSNFTLVTGLSLAVSVGLAIVQPVVFILGWIVAGKTATTKHA